MPGLLALWDFLPSACEMVGVKVPDGIDGISFLPALRGRRQLEPKYLSKDLGEAENVAKQFLGGRVGGVGKRIPLSPAG